MARNYSKPFMGWATGSRNNLFLWARLKLTFVYVTIITSILVVFSVGLYASINKNIRDSVFDNKGDSAHNRYIIKQNDNKIKEALLAGNIMLLFVSGGLAFFLAGKNLRPIKQALENQKRFNADASHDLRTPLAIMKTDCEVSLKKKTVSIGEFHELLNSNLEEINRMSEMVEQLLFLSRNNGKFNPKREAIPLGELAESMAMNFKNLAKSKNISLVVSQTAPGNIVGNRLEIEKMFLNILKNAIDYTPGGGSIEIFVQKNKTEMKLLIKDTGIGIASKDLPNVTEAFYKVDEARSEENGGAGLGLSIVKKIVEDNDGKFFITSELGVGSEVRVTFPELLT